MKKTVEFVVHLIFWFVLLILLPYVQYVGLVRAGYTGYADFVSFLGPRLSTEGIISLVIYIAGFYALYFVTSFALHQKREVRFAVYYSWLVLSGILLVFVVLGNIYYVVATCYFIILATAGLFGGVIKGIVLWLTGKK